MDKQPLELRLKKGDIPQAELDRLQRYAAVEEDHPDASVLLVVERLEADEPHFEVLTPGEVVDIQNDGPIGFRVYALAPDEILTATQNALTE